MNKKILIIDDELAIRKFLHASLTHAGYQVVEASTATEGVNQLIGQRPDLLILDLGLPDLDGYDFICKIREWSAVPIMVLTVKNDEENKVKVLDAGADDYLTKPFGVPELLARIRLALRHSDKEPEDNIFTSGALTVDFNAHQVSVNGQEVHLTVTEYAILKILIKHAGKVVTHRQLLKEIWGPNSVEHTQYLRVYVGHLRKKIESNLQNKFIITEPGVGYRFVGA